MAVLKPGDKAPDFELTDQNGIMVSLVDYRGRKVLLYFYPKAGTSGCTLQARSVRDAMQELAGLGADVMGISPDEPSTQQLFDRKHNLGYPILSDPDHVVADAYGVWEEKTIQGKLSEGIVRSAFLIDEEGKVIQTWYRVTPEDTVPKAVKELKG